MKFFYSLFISLLFFIGFLFVPVVSVFAETFVLPASSINHSGGTGCNANSNGLVIGDGNTCTTTANNSNAFTFRFSTDSDYADIWDAYDIEDLVEVKLRWKVNTTSGSGVLNTALRLTYNDNNSFAQPNFTGCTSDGNSSVTTSSIFDGTATTQVVTWTGACGQIFMNSTGLSRAKNPSDTFYAGLSVVRSSGTNSYVVDGAELTLKFGSPASFELDGYTTEPFEGKIKASFSGNLEVIDDTTDAFYCVIEVFQVQTPKTSDFVGSTSPVADIFVYDYPTTEEKNSEYRYTATGDLSTTGEWSVSNVDTPYSPYHNISYNMAYSCYKRPRQCSDDVPPVCTFGSDELVFEGQSTDPDGDFYYEGSNLPVDDEDTDPDFTVACSATDLICKLMGNLRNFFHEQFYLDPDIMAYKMANIKTSVSAKQPFGYGFAVFETDVSTFVDGTVTYPTFAYNVGGLYDFSWTPPSYVITVLNTVKTIIGVLISITFFVYVFHYVKRITGQ